MLKASISRKNVLFSTLFLVLVIIGYPLITSIFLPAVSDIEGISQQVTIPFRGGVLLLMLGLIVFNFKKQIRPFPAPLAILIIYWSLLIIRMTYDIFFRSDVYLNDTSQLWLYVFGICLAALITSIKTYDIIDYDKAFKWTWYGLFIILLLTLFSNQSLMSSEDAELRVDGNIALNTISFGNIGVSGLLLTLYMYKETNPSKLLKVLGAILLIISIYSMLRAGSRGPILNASIVLLFWYFAKKKRVGIGLISLLLLILVLFFARDFILSIMGNVAPVIEERIRATIEGRGGNERNVLYDSAINAFIDSPLIGKQFGIFDGLGGYAYAHNIILDSLMALGVIGGLAMIYILFCAIKASYINIHINNQYWLSLILLQQLSSLMVSGTFYQDQLLSVLLVLHFTLLKNKFLKWK